MEADRVALCGIKNVPDANRRAVRGGTTQSSVVLGGQRITVTKPRARSLKQASRSCPRSPGLPTRTRWTWSRWPRSPRACPQPLRRHLDESPEPDEPLSVSKSAVSRRWVALSQAQLHERLSCSLKEVALPVS